MKGRPGWVLLAALALLAGALVLAQANTQLDSPEHSSRSDGRNGTSAFRQYAAAMGHRVSSMDLDFSLPAPPATVFVFSPTSPYSASDTAALARWVEGGGTLVYGADRLDTRLALAFDLHPSRNQVPATGHPATPVFAGVQEVADDGITGTLLPTPDQAPLLAFGPGQALVMEQTRGKGRVISIATPEILCNGWLDKADNGRFAADLIALTPGPVVFDEYHHLAGAAASSDITTQPLGIGLEWAALAVFAGLLLRSRAFGPRIAIASGRGRSAAEYAAAVGHLLNRAGGRALTLQVVSDATRRALAARLGLGSERSLARLDDLLARRAPDLAQRYSDALREAGRADASDSGLIAAARRLHELAYPLARNPPGGKEKQ